MALSAVAAAEPPGLTDPVNTPPVATAPAPAPSYEVELAAELAGTQQGNFGTVGVVAAVSALHFLWFRFGVMAGSVAPRAYSCPAFAPCSVPTESTYELRAGLDARVCGLPMGNATAKQLICWFAGIDVVDANVAYMTSSEVLTLPHLGFDIGSRHVRARVAVELGVDGQGSAAAGLNAGVGYQW